MFAAFAEVAGALGSGRRAEIVDVLAQGERSVDEVADQIGQSVANTSHHLRTLARAGLVTTRREGTRIFYALGSSGSTSCGRRSVQSPRSTPPGWTKLARAYLGDRAELEAIDRARSVERMRRGDVVVLDVRPGAEYAAGHIAGARSLPIAELHRRLRELPDDPEIVAYCRGPYCVYADDAVRQLREGGFQASRLRGRVSRMEAGRPARRGRTRDHH